MTTTAIAERGEHELVLAGITYRLRPSHLAIVAIEEKLRLSALELLRLGNTGALRLGQLGAIACELIRAGADDELTRSVDADRIAELIYEEGLTRATFRLTHVLSDAVTGGRKVSGEAKAPAATTETAGAA